MNLTEQAVEAAANAMVNASPDLSGWDDLREAESDWYMRDARAALEAAKPFMYAQAWRDMANQLDNRDRRDGQVWLHAVIEEIRYRADDLEANPWSTSELKENQ